MHLNFGWFMLTFRGRACLEGKKFPDVVIKLVDEFQEKYAAGGRENTGPGVDQPGILNDEE